MFPEPGWRICAMTERGPSHDKTGRPNEDAVGALGADPAASDVRCAAVSDGHGERAYFRSERGATLAVEAALDVVSSYLTQSGSASQEELSRWAFDQLPDVTLARWRALVRRDADQDPFSRSELERASENIRSGDRGEEVVRAYGATLMGAAVVGKDLLCFQLGDGEIAAVRADGTVWQPLLADEQSFSNVTHSLCDREPVLWWRSAIVPSSEGVWFVVLASDGYSGAFEDRQAFLSTVGALAAVVGEQGIPKLRPTLRQSLLKAQQFTGDDATVAVLFRHREPRT